MIVYLAGAIRPKGDQTLEGNVAKAKAYRAGTMALRLRGYLSAREHRLAYGGSRALHVGKVVRRRLGNPCEVRRLSRFSRLGTVNGNAGGNILCEREGHSGLLLPRIAYAFVASIR